jgi:hypothetical protein
MADLSVIFEMDDGRSLAFGSIGVDYTAIGTAFDYPAVEVLIQNLTDATLSFSTDGINEKCKLPAAGYREIDIATNRQGAKSAEMEVGTTFYVKQVGVPTTGTVEVAMSYLR